MPDRQWGGVRCLLFLLCAWTSSAQTADRIRMHLLVEGHLSNQFASQINKQIRALGDVDTVEDGFTLMLGVDVVPSRLKNGDVIGFFVEALGVQIFSKDEWLAAQPAEMRKLRSLSLPNNPMFLLYSEVFSGAGEDIASVCEKIVAGFDSKALQPFRDKRPVLREELKKLGVTDDPAAPTPTAKP